MIVWLVAIRSARYGLNATAHRSESDALEYVRYLYKTPDYLAQSDILGWVGDKSDDEVLVDYDEM